MNEEIQSYLKHILQAINDIESFIGDAKIFVQFENDFKTRFAVERALEIIGEAMGRILKIDGSFPLPMQNNYLYKKQDHSRL